MHEALTKTISSTDNLFQLQLRREGPLQDSILNFHASIYRTWRTSYPPECVNNMRSFSSVSFARRNHILLDFPIRHFCRETNRSEGIAHGEQLMIDMVEQRPFAR